ncbi:hypothetical protein GVAMD_0359 [Gardnerella vaginalis AMD]|nr:hypothetical protein GVAMD_0359 [Gardnerella vaginalis AMD]
MLYKDIQIVSVSCLLDNVIRFYCSFWDFLLNVARVLGDFSPRTSRPSCALAAKRA